MSVLIALAACGPVLWRVSVDAAVDVLASLSPPSFDHPMGTDDVDRDIFARFDEGALQASGGIAVMGS